MTIEGQKFYPGEKATPAQLLLLAGEYRRAANALLPIGRPKERLSRWPYRLLAIHAIELYLNAFLLEKGHPATSVRGMQHNLAARTDLALKQGLVLRKLTAGHLRMMTQTREYLIARYWPDPAEEISQPNRLDATLSEIAKKVEAAVSR